MTIEKMWRFLDDRVHDITLGIDSVATMRSTLQPAGAVAGVETCSHGGVFRD